jgi:enoyl-CoA hydratase/carnithine racemase
MSEDVVLSERHGGVLLVTLNRPEVLNALTLEMDARYRQMLAGAEADPEIRAVVVTGAGRAFCAGADLTALEALAEDPERPHFGAAFRTPLTFSKPLIAAINGGCVGLGLVTALLCDVRFVADEAKLGTAFAQRGVVAEHGLSVLLSRLAGVGTAMDLLLSGRVVLGQEAVRLGLATRSVPREDIVRTALEYAGEIARNCSPASVAVIKKQVQESFLGEFHRAADSAEPLLRAAFRHPDYVEGIRSYREKRSPRFAGQARGAGERAPWN